MPAFDAGTVAEPLDFTFEPFVKGCHGTIREPSDKQIGKFLSEIKALVAKVDKEVPGGVTGDDPQALIQASENLDPEAVVSLMSSMARVYTDLCSGSPSAEQILGLPIRRRQGFYNWLQSEVMSPEAGPGAGRAQVMTLPRAAAG